MKTALIMLFMGLLSLGIHANNSEEITYQGQNGDTINLETINTVTRYREEMRDTTCTRQIPYTVEECGYETRDRQECRWEPGRNVCRTEYDRVCRSVTRYRQECRTTPGRQVCRNTPPRQICRNGRCRTEPSRRICDTKPGERICRQVPYQDRECDSVPRQVCDRVPGRNVCTDVPYQEYICRDVTRYRSEDYPCRKPVQIPYTFDRKVSAEVNISYRDKSPGALVDFEYFLTEGGEIQVNAKDKSNKPVLISLVKDDQIDRQADSTETRSSVELKFLDKERELSPIKKAISGVGLSESAAWFSTGVITNPKNVNIRVKITRKTILGNTRTPFEKELKATDFRITPSGDRSKLTLDLSKYGVELKSKKHKVEIKVALKLGGEILNPTRGDLSRSDRFEVRVP